MVLAQRPSSDPASRIRRLPHVKEKIGATRLPVFADILADLDESADRVGVQGGRYNEHHMSLADK
ncbi:hypothetical protein [Streptomyces tibetensis]|uniref:hypothetical protein n=1 Tax=Streptomyces tibetensis TaxID=2382123 RepID=UPI0033DD0344